MSSVERGASAATDDVSDFQAALDSLKAEILDAIAARHAIPVSEEIDDDDLRAVVDRLQLQIGLLVRQAVADKRVDLRLDDLFEVVSHLTQEAGSVDAIDVELNRWESDVRAITYFAQTVAALSRGAQMRRIYVIGPRVTGEAVDGIAETITKHIECNDNDRVRDAGGRLEVAAVFHQDLPDGGAPRDFALFDGDKVLLEEFTAGWTSTFRGRLTKDPIEVTECDHYFQNVWKRAVLLRSRNDVMSWALAITERIEQSGYLHDVFLGYAHEAKATAKQIKDYIESRGYKVFDWMTMAPGPELFGAIERACDQSRLGLFLFTADDIGPRGPAARENVILELGYFLAKKGADRVVAIFEKGSTPPTDTHAHIWLPLSDRTNTSSIDTKLLDWLQKQIGYREPRG